MPSGAPLISARLSCLPEEPPRPFAAGEGLKPGAVPSPSFGGFRRARANIGVQSWMTGPEGRRLGWCRQTSSQDVRFGVGFSARLVRRSPPLARIVSAPLVDAGTGFETAWFWVTFAWAGLMFGTP